MTIAELKEKLSEYPEDTKVCLADDIDEWGDCTVAPIREVWTSTVDKNPKRCKKFGVYYDESLEDSKEILILYQ